MPVHVPEYIGAADDGRIAQLSTAAGVRAPLSQLADQVFLELSRELSAQRVRQKVADMFGMALRSYQMKVRRLSAGGTDPALTLWQALHDRLARDSATRRELEAAFKGHATKDVAATLQDMAESGIAYVSGRGQGAVYGLTSEADRKRASAADHSSASADMAWYPVASGAASTRQDVARELRCEPAEIEATIDSLVADGRLREENGLLASRRFEIAVGAEKVWASRREAPSARLCGMLASMSLLPDPVWPTLVLAFICLVDAVLCIRPAAFIAQCLEDVKWPRKYWRVLPIIKLAAAVGLTAGIWVSGLGLVTCAALVLYFVVAVSLHVRARDFGKNLFVNAIGMLITSIAALLYCFVL